MAALVTLAVAKGHLHVTVVDAVADADLTLKIDQASAIVITYLKAQADDTWTAATVPTQVQAAVLTLVGQLVASRGDGDVPDDSQWQRYLAMLRDPALA
jgi:hypothetical protein